MRVTIDTDKGTLTNEAGKTLEQFSLYSTAAFETLSTLWLKVGWNQKYSYTFSWFGRPVIQLPEDLVRIQEVIYRIRPDVIIETGIAHGGSLIFYASLCKAMGSGRVVGVDIEIRPGNRAAIEQHELSQWISLLEGSSVAPQVVEQVRARISCGETVLVILDSLHSEDHVLAELESYHELVTPGSYIIATDGIMGSLHDVPRGMPEWGQHNPVTAARAFVEQHQDFVLEQPSWPFNESELLTNVTHWPGAWLKKLR